MFHLHTQSKIGLILLQLTWICLLLFWIQQQFSRMQPGVPVVMIMTISVKRECPFPDGGWVGVVRNFATGQATAKTSQKSIQQETCLNFNQDKCKHGSECSHKHICQRCGDPKPFSQCSISGPCSNNS